MDPLRLGGHACLFRRTMPSAFEAGLRAWMGSLQWELVGRMQKPRPPSSWGWGEGGRLVGEVPFLGTPTRGCTWSQTQGLNLPQDPLLGHSPPSPQTRQPLPSSGLPSPGLGAAVTQAPASRREAPTRPVPGKHWMPVASASARVPLVRKAPPMADPQIQFASTPHLQPQSPVCPCRVMEESPTGLGGAEQVGPEGAPGREPNLQSS